MGLLLLLSPSEPDKLLLLPLGCAFELLSAWRAKSSLLRLPCPSEPLRAPPHLPQHAPASLPSVCILAAAAALDTCGTVVANATVDCSLQLYVGFNGDDKNSVTFNSGWMIARINQFSVATLYNNALQAVRLMLCCF